MRSASCRGRSASSRISTPRSTASPESIASGHRRSPSIPRSSIRISRSPWVSSARTPIACGRTSRPRSWPQRCDGCSSAGSVISSAPRRSSWRRSASWAPPTCSWPTRSWAPMRSGFGSSPHGFRRRGSRFWSRASTSCGNGSGAISGSLSTSTPEWIARESNSIAAAISPISPFGSEMPGWSSAGCTTTTVISRPWSRRCARRRPTAGTTGCSSWSTRFKGRERRSERSSRPVRRRFRRRSPTRALPRSRACTAYRPGRWSTETAPAPPSCPPHTVIGPRLSCFQRS